MAKQQTAHLSEHKTPLQVKPSRPRASTGRSSERAWGSAPPSPPALLRRPKLLGAPPRLTPTAYRAAAFPIRLRHGEGRRPGQELRRRKREVPPAPAFPFRPGAAAKGKGSLSASPWSLPPFLRRCFPGLSPRPSGEGSRAAPARAAAASPPLPAGLPGWKFPLTLTGREERGGRWAGAAVAEAEGRPLGVLHARHLPAGGSGERSLRFIFIYLFIFCRDCCSFVAGLASSSLKVREIAATDASRGQHRV